MPEGSASSAAGEGQQRRTGTGSAGVGPGSRRLYPPASPRFSTFTVTASTVGGTDRCADRSSIGFSRRASPCGASTLGFGLES